MKRRAGFVAILAAAALALTGCSASAAPEPATTTKAAGPVTLTWWTWWTGAPGMVKVWNAKHPDIQVQVTNVGGGTDQFTKLNAAVRAGKGPDLALAEYQWLPSYVSNGVAADISKYVGGIQKQYNPALWNLVKLGGGVYGVPLDQGPMLLMYRADLFEKYGIAVPKTWAEFATAAAQVKAKDPSAVLANMPSDDAGWMAGLTAQTGTSWWEYKDDKWAVNIDSKASKKVGSYWQKLVEQGLVSTGATGTPDFNSNLNSGKILTQVIGSWGATGSSIQSGAPDTVGKWRIATLPRWGASKDVGFQGGSSTLVTKTSKHPQEAAQFLAWLGSTKEGQSTMTKQGGNFPASKEGLKVYKTLPQPAGRPVADQDDFQDVLMDVAAHESKVAWGPNTTVAFSAYKDQMPKAVSQKSSFSSALDAVQDTVATDLKKSGFKVK